MKTCSTLLANREKQIKTTMKYHFIPTRMTKIKNRITSVGENRDGIGTIIYY